MHQRGGGDDGAELGASSSELRLNHGAIRRLDTRGIRARVRLERSVAIREEVMEVIAFGQQVQSLADLRSKCVRARRMEARQCLQKKKIYELAKERVRNGSIFVRRASNTK